MKTLEEFLKENGAKYDESTREFLTNCEGESITPYRIEDNSVYSRYSGLTNFKNYRSTLYNVFKVRYDDRLDKFFLDPDNTSLQYTYINSLGHAMITYNIDDLVLDISSGNYTEKSNCVKIGVDYVFTKYSSDYAECKSCHKAIRISSMEENMCNTCYMDAKAQVCGYHDHKKRGVVKFFGAKQENFKGYGLELECEGKVNASYSTQDCRNAVHNLLGDRVYFERDGSLRNDGFETITRPHTKEELFKIDWKAVLKCYSDNGMISHTTNRCGLHIHASRTLFGDDKDTQDDNVAKIIFFHEYFWDDMVKFSRRTNFGYCEKSIRDGYITEDQAKKFAKIKRGNRYYAINTTNDNTIEFRLPRGTLKYETFMATLDFITKIIENAKTLTWVDVYDKNKWLVGISDDTRRYLTSRHAFTDIEYKTAPRNIGEI